MQVRRRLLGRVLARVARHPLVQFVLADRLWSLLEDPLRFLTICRPGACRLRPDQAYPFCGGLADEYRVTVAGQAALASFGLNEAAGRQMATTETARADLCPRRLMGLIAVYGAVDTGALTTTAW